MAPQHSHTEPDTVQPRLNKIARHRRYHPYRRNVATLQRTDDDNYRAVYESSIPILGMAKPPVEGIVEFRNPGEAREGRVERMLGAVLRFVAGLRRKAEEWLGVNIANALPQPPAAFGPANDNN